MLACLLLAGQALTAYLVFNQRGQIHDMQKSNDNMRKQLRNRPPGRGGRGGRRWRNKEGRSGVDVDSVGGQRRGK